MGLFFFMINNILKSETKKEGKKLHRVPVIISENQIKRDDDISGKPNADQSDHDIKIIIITLTSYNPAMVIG